MDEGSLQRDLPVAWIGVEQLPLLFADQFVIQRHEDTFVLTIGQAVIPAFLGSPEDRAKQLAQTSHVAVKPIARVAINPTKLKQLITALQQIYGQQENSGPEAVQGG